MISPETVALPFSSIVRLFAINMPPKMELPPSETLPPVPTTLNKTWLSAKPGKRHCFGRYRKIGRLPVVRTELF
jgi:hypothetical protein